MHKAPRERLIAAANELFYAEGIGAVGVSRLIERADVGQMSLWRTFGSKQGLVEAWLRELDENLLAEMRAALDHDGGPRERIGAVFDAYALRDGRYYLGCPLIKAAAEPAGSPQARAIACEHKKAALAIFEALATEAGVGAPEVLATQLLCLIEGAGITAGLGATDRPMASARAAALVLLDAALAATAAPDTALRPANLTL